MTKEIKKINVGGGFQHAPWNPRTESDLSHANPEIQKLAASIAKNGLLQPIGVWVRDGESSLIIYGNRRFEAAKVAAIGEIDAYIYKDIDQEQAMMMTRQENENRFGVNALLDARLLRDASDRGMSQAEIAAACGVSEATICRRMKLQSLDQAICEGIEAADYETRALELIASYPSEVQKLAKNTIIARARHDKITANFVRDVMSYYTNEISPNSWVFKGQGGGERLAKCRSCGMCSGTQPELFEEYYSDERPVCMDKSCYKRMIEAVKKKLIDVATEGAEGVVVLKNSWSWPSDTLKDKKTKNNVYAYVFWMEYAHDVQVRWGLSPEYYEAEKKRKEEAERDEKEIDRVKREKIDADYNSAVEKFNKAFFPEGANLDIGSDDDGQRDCSIIERVFEAYFVACGNVNSWQSQAAHILHEIFLRFGFCRDDLRFDPENFESESESLFFGSADECAKVAAKCLSMALFNGLRSGEKWYSRGSNELRVAVAEAFAQKTDFQNIIRLTNDELNALKANI